MSSSLGVEVMVRRIEVAAVVIVVVRIVDAKSFEPTLNKSHDQCLLIYETCVRFVTQLFFCLYLVPPPSSTANGLPHTSKPPNHQRATTQI